jgi:imidazole glycerol-phosphate synthase subunit HisF
MKRVRAIPVIMIAEGRAVITRKFKDPVYVGDPINSIRILNEKEVDELVILDITSKRKRSVPDFGLIEKMASESFMPLAYGGHVSTVAHAEALINSGIEKICFNTALFDHPEVVKELSYRIGRQSVVASIDIGKNWLGTQIVKTANGTRNVDGDIETILSQVLTLGVGEIFLNSIERDGMRAGYDIQLVKRISNQVNVPLIACGGASSITDFVQAVRDGNASAVAAGAMFFFKGGMNAVLVNYPDQKTLVNDFYSKV